MSSADLLEDGFPHGTVAGYRRGCQGAGACPNSQSPALMTCRDANVRYASDYAFRRHIDNGGTWTSQAAVGAASEAVAPKPQPRPAAARRAGADEDLRRKLAAADFPHGTVDGFTRGCVRTELCPADDLGRTCKQARQEQLAEHEQRRRGDIPTSTDPKEQTTVDTATPEPTATQADPAPAAEDSVPTSQPEKTTTEVALDDALHEKMSHDERWRHYNKGCRHPLCYEAKKQRAADIAAGTVTPKRKPREVIARATGAVPAAEVAAAVAQPTETAPPATAIPDQVRDLQEQLRLATDDVTRLEETRQDHLTEIQQLQAAVHLREKTIDRLTGELLDLTKAREVVAAPDVRPLSAAADKLTAAIAQLHTITAADPLPEASTLEAPILDPGIWEAAITGTSGVALVLTNDEAATVIHALASTRP